MALPKLTDEQRRAALQKATVARRRRAEVKAALKARTMTLAEVFELAETDEAVAKMKVTALLEAMPRVGAITAENILDSIGIARSRRVRGLGALQRNALIERFH
ncbi:integration host factor, actinobacterial type [Gleimia hominis]|uniref:Integration host factor, actinobacterial type n=1 Tax=Gleimia hominis TaxID=595468 RepID=A0ABU3IBB5_9ACTO|nr:integration host factor, actinobacterial type [Gleimia hominis]MDT3767672.1 integration host factor, actinobacterial type [Gleimia hominis]WIK65089.1 integration host factor, actinobacterial type [Gleimia hominis]